LDTAAYLVRNPLSLEKLVYLDGQQAVLYRSKLNPFLGRNFEALDPLEWLARMSDHICDPGQHRTLFYGEYANRVRGEGQLLEAGTSPLSAEPPRKRCSPSWARLIANVYQVARSWTAGPSSSPLLGDVGAGNDLSTGRADLQLDQGGARGGRVRLPEGRRVHRGVWVLPIPAPTADTGAHHLGVVGRAAPGTGYAFGALSPPRNMRDPDEPGRKNVLNSQGTPYPTKVGFWRTLYRWFVAANKGAQSLAGVGLLAILGTTVLGVRWGLRQTFRYPIELKYVGQSESQAGYILKLQMQSTNGDAVFVPRDEFEVTITHDEGRVQRLSSDERRKLLSGETVKVFDNPHVLRAEIEERTYTSDGTLPISPAPRSVFLLVRVANGSGNPSLALQLSPIYRSLLVAVRRNGWSGKYLEVPIRRVPIVSGNDKMRIIQE
jgi:hypothetical protein